MFFVIMYMYIYVAQQTQMMTASEQNGQRDVEMYLSVHITYSNTHSQTLMAALIDGTAYTLEIYGYQVNLH